MDSFLWPFAQEMEELTAGIHAFDILSGTLFVLCVYLIIVFGDIPAVSMLPLCTHDGLLAQAREVQSATTAIDTSRLAKVYSIKSIPLLSYLPTLFFPTSFPYNFMHLIWENLIKNLVLYWTGEFKKLDEGDEEYELQKAMWQGVRAGTAKSRSTIPSVYGARVPNVATNNGGYIFAEMWSFWTLHPGPILLRHCFKNKKCYKHFIRLVELLTVCLQFIKTIYNVQAELSLKPPHGAVDGLFSDLFYPTRVLLLPHIRVAPTADTLGRIAAALATQFSVSVAVAKAFLRNLQVEQWGKVHRVNSTEGDTMRASIMGSTRDDSHDVSHIIIHGSHIFSGYPTVP
ncbi:hypothetical protein FIBSPDRAFT_943038 [Athelia psychrophila]|uniref:Uncharacterized protein n=1 Tax=Athelia psychrophila TaxID=1759441 RepID=A0A166WNE4_9AGAM|nr:hypothetical protein FIBSPDRAFT_943038 [Fibularhizoctonia sp. CBS 109695]